MKANARQVAIDILRELGHEDEARWLEHPEAVRELLKHEPIERVDYEEVGCAGSECGGGDPASDYREPHSRDCSVIAAWRALGDPRAEIDLHQAHQRAIDDSAREMRLVAQAKCPHHHVKVETRGSATCPACGKWWPKQDVASAVEGRKPIDWGDSPGARMESVRRALRGGLINEEQARRILRAE